MKAMLSRMLKNILTQYPSTIKITILSLYPETRAKLGLWLWINTWSILKHPYSMETLITTLMECWIFLIVNRKVHTTPNISTVIWFHNLTKRGKSLIKLHSQQFPTLKSNILVSEIKLWFSGHNRISIKKIIWLFVPLMVLWSVKKRNSKEFMTSYH